jgi:hypothetical protein
MAEIGIVDLDSILVCLYFVFCHIIIIA